MPYSKDYWAGESIMISAVIQPNWLFNQWQTYTNTILPNINIANATFIASNSDSCVLKTRVKPPVKAFISGNDTVCDNEEATVQFAFSGGIPPYTFVYAVNGINQAPLTTNASSYTIYTKEAGSYTLTSFSDDNEVGSISGSGLVTHLSSPEAFFRVLPDSVTIIDTRVEIDDDSESLNGEIVNWDWNFGDGNTLSINDYRLFDDTIKKSLYYSDYPNSKGVYQISLIVHDDQGCADTTQNLIVISDFYSIYIPNSFSPDLDGKNDRFCLVYSGIREGTFLFRVFNSQLDLMYQSTIASEMQCGSEGGWDGTHYSTNKNLPADTYLYDISYQDFEGWKHQEYGKIILVR